MNGRYERIFEFFGLWTEEACVKGETTGFDTGKTVLYFKDSLGRERNFVDDKTTIELVAEIADWLADGVTGGINGI